MTCIHPLWGEQHGYVTWQLCLLKGGKLSLDLWTAVTRAERPDVPVYTADSSCILWFHSDWQGTAYRAAQEKPAIMAGWSEQRWKKKPKKKEGEGRKKKGVGALSHTHTHARHCSSPHLQGNLCSHTHRLFYFLFFLTKNLSKLYHQRWRKGRENWMKTDKWKCMPSLLTICQLHFPFIWH